FAASYSAFSDKSPCARASAIALMTHGRSMVFRRCSSALSFSAPALVIGMVAISKRREKEGKGLEKTEPRPFHLAVKLGAALKLCLPLRRLGGSRTSCPRQAAV